MNKEEDTDLEAEYIVKCFKSKYAAPELEGLGLQVNQITMVANKRNTLWEKIFQSSESGVSINPTPIDIKPNILVTIEDIEPDIINYFHNELTSALRTVIQKTGLYNSYRIAMLTGDFSAEEIKNKFEKTFGEPLINKTSSKKGRKSAKPPIDRLIKLANTYKDQLHNLYNIKNTYKELYKNAKGATEQRRKEASNKLIDIYIEKKQPLLADIIDWVALNCRMPSEKALQLAARLCGIKEGLRTLKEWKKEGELATKLAENQLTWLKENKSLFEAKINISNHSK